MEKTQIHQEINITDALMKRINELISHYPADKKKSALLPVLHEVQDAHDNWLSTDLQIKVAEILEIQPIEVFSSSPQRPRRSPPPPVSWATSTRLTCRWCTRVSKTCAWPARCAT